MPGNEIRPAASYAADRASATDGPRPVTARMRPPFVTRRSPCRAVPAWNTSAPSASASATPVMPPPRSPSAGIPLCREHDGHRRARGRADLDSGCVALRGSREHLEKICVEQRDDRLRLGIAEAAVELENARAVRRSASVRRRAARRTARHATRARRARARAPLRRAPPPPTVPSSETGAYAPMPPVFGPSSPSKARLKSCAETSGSAWRPSQIAKSETSGPSRSSSTTTSPPAPCSSRIASSTSTCVRQTKTPLPAARPSAFTTHGGRAIGSRAAAGTPAAAMTSFANAFEPSIRAAAALGPKTRKPNRRRASARPSTSGSSGPDDDEIHLERARQAEQPLGVVRANRMALGEVGDARIPRRGVQRRQRRRLRELPDERMLATARPDDEDAHPGESTKRSRA